MNDFEQKLLKGPFIMFSNLHPEFSRNMEEEEVANILEDMHLPYLFISAVNGRGTPMNYFLVSTESVSYTELYDLEALISQLEQRYIIISNDDGKFLLRDIENDKVVASASEMKFLDEIPKKDYYVTPMGQVFIFDFEKVEE